MNRIFVKAGLLAFATGSLVYFSIIPLEINPYGLISSISFSLIIFFTFLSLNQRKEDTDNIITRPSIFVLLFWIVSILLVIFIPTFDVETIFVEWREIQLVNWFKAFASYLLAFFFPGYAILNSIIKINLSRLEKWLLSIHLSMLITALTVLISLTFLSTSIILIIVNVILLLLFVIYNINHFHFEVSVFLRHNIDMAGFAILFILVLYSASTIWIIFLDKFFLGYDHWHHFGEILKILRARTLGRLLTTSFQYILFYSLNTGYIVLSGLPALNAYLMLFFLGYIHICSFYALAKRLFNNSVAVSAAMIYATFGGFGGIQLLCSIILGRQQFIPVLRILMNRNRDLIWGVHQYSFFYQPSHIALSCLFIMILMLHTRFSSKLSWITLMSGLFVLGYCSHMPELIIFVLLLIPLSVFYREFIAISWWNIVAVLLVGSFTSICLLYYETLQNNIPLIRLAGGAIKYSVHLIVLIVAAVSLINIISKALCKLKIKSFGIAHVHTCVRVHNLNSWLFMILVGFTLLSLMALNSGHPYRASQVDAPLLLVHYPQRYGIAFVLALVSLIYLRKKSYARTLIFGSIFLATIFIAGRTISYSLLYLNIQLPYDENRLSIIGMGGVALLAAPALTEMLCVTRGHPKRIWGQIRVRIKGKMFTIDITSRKIIAILIPLILISGFSSIPIVAKAHYSTIWGYFTNKEQFRISTEELQLLDVISRNYSGSLILATRPLESAVRDFTTLMRPIDLGKADSLHLIQASPEFTLIALNNHLWRPQWRIQYSLNNWPSFIFWNNATNQHLLGSPQRVSIDYSRSFIVSNLVKHLPVIAEAGRIRVLKLPRLTSPLPYSDTALIKPTYGESFSLESYKFCLLSLAFMRANYTVLLDSDIALGSWQFKTLIVPFDPPPKTELTAKLLEYVRKGGTLVVLKSDPEDGFASDLFEIDNAVSSVIANSIIIEDHQIMLSNNVSVLLLPISNGDNSIRGYYSFNDEKKTPFAFSRTLGKGKILLVRLAPILSTLDIASNNIDIEIFFVLSHLFESMRMPIGAVTFDTEQKSKAISYGMRGFFLSNVTIRTQSLSVRDLEKDYFNITIKNPDGEIVRYLRNVRIKDIRIEGNYSILISAPLAHINGYGTANYITIFFPKGYLIRLGIKESSKATLILEGNFSYATHAEISVEEGQILLSTEGYPEQRKILFNFNLDVAQVITREKGNYDLRVQETTDGIQLEVVQGEMARVALYALCDPPLDLTKASNISLRLRFKGTRSYTQWSFIIYAPDSKNKMRYDFVDDFTGWRNLDVPLGQFSPVGEPDLSKVSAMGFRGYPQSTSTNFVSISLIESTPPSQLLIKTPEVSTKSRTQFELIDINLPTKHQSIIQKCVLVDNGFSARIEAASNNIILMTDLNANETKILETDVTPLRGLSYKRIRDAEIQTIYYVISSSFYMIVILLMLVVIYLLLRRAPLNKR